MYNLKERTMALVTTNNMRMVIRGGRFHELTLVQHPNRKVGPLIELKSSEYEDTSLFLGLTAEELYILREWIDAVMRRKDVKYYCSCGQEFTNAGDFVVHLAQSNANWPWISANDEHKQVSYQTHQETLVKDDRSDDEEPKEEPDEETDELCFVVWGKDEDASLIPDQTPDQPLPDQSRATRLGRIKIRDDSV
jgi:hypothetical protein